MNMSGSIHQSGEHHTEMKDNLNNSSVDCCHNLTLIRELQQTNEKLLGDIQIMKDKLEVDNQNTQIQLQLLRKELGESKAEAEGSPSSLEGAVSVAVAASSSEEAVSAAAAAAVTAVAADEVKDSKITAVTTKVAAKNAIKA